MIYDLDRIIAESAQRTHHSGKYLFKSSLKYRIPKYREDDTDHSSDTESDKGTELTWHSGRICVNAQQAQDNDAASISSSSEEEPWEVDSEAEKQDEGAKSSSSVQDHVPAVDTLDECAICYEDLDPNAPEAEKRVFPLTGCPHKFHQACIEPVFRGPGGGKCPTCRQNPFVQEEGGVDDDESAGYESSESSRSRYDITCDDCGKKGSETSVIDCSVEDCNACWHYKCAGLSEVLIAGKFVYCSQHMPDDEPRAICLETPANRLRRDKEQANLAKATRESCLEGRNRKKRERGEGSSSGSYMDHMASSDSD